MNEAQRSAKRAYMKIYNRAHRKEHSEYMKRYSAAHREEKKAYNKRYRLSHFAELVEKNRLYYFANQTYILARKQVYNASHKIPKPLVNSRMRTWRRATYRKAVVRIAAHWGDNEPRCRPDTLPNGHPLRTLPCYGAIWIDHMNGAGYQEYKAYGAPEHFYRAIVTGTRSCEGLRLLCLLHQLWNR